jgi:hypothetical protein
MGILSVTKYTVMVCFRPERIDLPALSTEVQGNHREERAANDICPLRTIFHSQISAMSAKKDGHNSMNHGYEQDESKK